MEQGDDCTVEGCPGVLTYEEALCICDGSPEEQSGCPGCTSLTLVCIECGEIYD